MATQHKTASGVPRPKATDEIDVVDIQGIADKVEDTIQNIASHMADYATVTTVSTSRNRMRVVEGSVIAQKIGKLVIITFEYNPSLNSFEFSKYDTNVITVNNFTPRYRVAGSAYPSSSSDINHHIKPYITQTGAIGVVNNLNSNTDSGKWTCTLVYLTD